MAYKDLREWIARLDRAGELVTISQPVSPYLEMAEIADRTAKLPGTRAEIEALLDTKTDAPVGGRSREEKIGRAHV